MDEDYLGTSGLMAEDTMTILPGLMQNQREKYGPYLFQKDDRGYYTCFFRGCGKQLQANFSRHIARHEMDNDEIDPMISTHLQALSYKANAPATPMQVCSHPNHEGWWNTDPELPVTEFYNRSSKCKKCYIRQQQESKKARLKDSSLVGVQQISSPTTTPSKMGSVMLTPVSTRQAATPYKPSNLPPATAFFNNAPSTGTSVGATTPFILSRPPREINRKHFNSVLMKRLKAIITTLMDHTDAWPFNQPVDVVRWGLKDYFDVIKKPMDLRTISENMEGGKYQTPAQFADDVRLVWANAKTYNKIESEIYDFATNLSAMFEDMYKKIVADTEAEAKAEAEMEQPSDICAICGTGSQPKPPVPGATPAKGMFVNTSYVTYVYPAAPSVPATPTTVSTAPATPVPATPAPATPAPTAPAPPSSTPAASATPAPDSSTAPSTPSPVNLSTPAPTTPAPATPAPQTPATVPSTPAAPAVRPIMHCDGSCLRAFHPSCLGLTEVSAPWLCNECRNGKPVLHWDPAKQEYFYYYYEATATEADTDIVAQEKTTFGKPSTLGMLPQEVKRKLRDEEEALRVKEMYYDALWCMWRCKSRDIVRQREDRQKPLLKEFEGGDEEEIVLEKKKQRL